MANFKLINIGCSADMSVALAFAKVVDADIRVRSDNDSKRDTAKVPGATQDYTQ